MDFCGGQSTGLERGNISDGRQRESRGAGNPQTREVGYTGNDGHNGIFGPRFDYRPILALILDQNDPLGWGERVIFFTFPVGIWNSGDMFDSLAFSSIHLTA